MIIFLYYSWFIFLKENTDTFECQYRDEMQDHIFQNMFSWEAVFNLSMFD